MVFKMKIIIIKIGIFCLNLIYSFLKLFKTQHKITFISRQSNSVSLDFQMLADEFKRKDKTIKIVMLPKMLNNKVSYFFHMFRQMYHIATSKVVILDSYCIPICILKHKKSLKVMQIWHAIGCMKKFGYAMLDKEEGHSTVIAKTMKMHQNYDYCFISSLSFKKDFIEGFNITEDKIIEIPLPRVDVLLDKKYKEQKRQELYKRIPALKKKKNILYCGTFRKDENMSNENIKRLINEIDFSKYNLLYKPHPFNKITTDDPRVIKDFESTLEASMVADYVICDYSSMIYEVGLLNIPIYIYAYDWDEYKHKRELNFDMEHEIPTLFTKDPKEIMKKIEKNDFDHKKFQEFTYKNVTLPKKRSCTEEMVAFISKYL